MSFRRNGGSFSPKPISDLSKPRPATAQRPEGSPRHQSENTDALIPLRRGSCHPDRRKAIRVLRSRACVRSCKCMRHVSAIRFVKISISQGISHLKALDRATAGSTPPILAAASQHRPSRLQHSLSGDRSRSGRRQGSFRGRTGQDRTAHKPVRS